MVLEDLFCAFIFYPATHISTRPQQLLPIQMMSGQVCIKLRSSIIWTGKTPYGRIEISLDGYKNKNQKKGLPKSYILSVRNVLSCVCLYLMSDHNHTAQPRLGVCDLTCNCLPKKCD